MILMNSTAPINPIFLTLTTDTILSGITASGYTLSIYSQQQAIPLTIAMTDISPAPWRYNEFQISGASITIGNGYYNYIITNSAYSATTLETGKVLITGGTNNIVIDVDLNLNNTRLIDNN